MTRRLALVLGLLAALACAPKAPVAAHAATGDHLAALRDAFNADDGKTRVVALLSPT